MPNGFAQMGQQLGGVLSQMGQSRLAGQAMQGDPQALAKLSYLNPGAAQQITDRFQQQKLEQQAAEIQRLQQLRMQQKEARLQQEAQLARDDRIRKIATENLEVTANIMDGLSDVASYEQYATEIERLRQNPVITRLLGEDVDYLLDASPQAFEKMKRQAAQEQTPFAGKEIKQQTLNMLVRGAKDPAFRNTPEYALAWREYTKPTTIQTPSGPIRERPQLDPRFKQPGPEALGAPVSEDEIILDEDAPPVGSPKNLEYIPGTKKLSVDQKDYNKDWYILDKINNSMDAYIYQLQKAGPTWDKGYFTSPRAAKLFSAYENLVVDFKELKKLGVINGPDEKILRRIIGDPTTLSAQTSGADTVEAAAKQAKKQITFASDSLNDMYKDVPVTIRTLPELSESLARRATEEEKEEEDKEEKGKAKVITEVAIPDDIKKILERY